MSGCHASLQRVLHEHDGINDVTRSAGSCDYAWCDASFRLDLIICKQQTTISKRGPASLDDLARADGILFVADSQTERMQHNERHLRVLRTDLEPFGVNIDDVPIIFQLNKADLVDVPPVPRLVPADVMTARLSTRRCSHVVTSATTGLGIFESIDRVIELIVARAER
jgi:50S ribosomal subunit-associated GTPase HflX